MMCAEESKHSESKRESSVLRSGEDFLERQVYHSCGLVEGKNREERKNASRAAHWRNWGIKDRSLVSLSL